jgi:hypothetical protein
VPLPPTTDRRLARRLARHHPEFADGDPTYGAAAHQWLPADFDDIAAVDAVGAFNPVAEPERAVAPLRTLLPLELRQADCSHSRLVGSVIDVALVL